MPAPGSVWAADTWNVDAWAADTWADADPVVANSGRLMMMGIGSYLLGAVIRLMLPN